LRGPGGQLGKGFDAWVQRPGKGAYRHFVVVARVDYHHVRVADQGVPVLRLDVAARARGGADAGHTHGDDLFFQPHLHAVTGRAVRPRFFVHLRGLAQGLSSSVGTGLGGT